MPRRREIVQNVHSHFPRIRENSRLMQTHENMVDLISGRQSAGSFMDVLTSGVFGLDFDLLRNLDEDLIYSDDDDDDDDDDDNVSHKTLQPHPRIRQLTEEEADRHAKELIEEEQRRKEKTEKNKRKKMRKKEKKRLEKENAVKKIISEEDQGMSDASENQEDDPVIESKREKSPESDRTQKAAEVVESSDYKNEDDKEEKALTTNKKDDEEQEDLDLKNSYVSSTESEPKEEETFMQPPARARKKQKSKAKLPDVRQQSTEKKHKDVLEKPGVQQKAKEEEEQEPDEEKTASTMKEEFAKRSRALAGTGNRLAASGEYDTAVRYFTAAIKYNPKEFKLFGNRSLCYERMQKYERALADADLALSMEPNWIKGLFRKGKALCGLKKYYEASQVYNKVLELDSSSDEAKQELKRTQTLHLMEIGFTWAQSSDALKVHSTLDEAIEGLFETTLRRPPQDRPSDVGAVQETTGECTARPLSRSRTQQVSEQGSNQNRSNSLSPTPRIRSGGKPELFPIWVGSLAPSVTYATLHDLFSRAGAVFSIKMLLEQQCAFVNYTCREDCERAIRAFNGMVVEGAPLSVRYPNRVHNGLGASKSASTDPYAGPPPFRKECFFWRTTGCTRPDCTFRHDPLHKNIDRDKFTSRLGNVNM